MPSLKDLRNRIASVKATQKITKAMQMVAAAKLRRAQSAAEAARPYAQHMGQVLGTSPRRSSPVPRPHRLLRARPGRVHLLVVCTAERGLCGAFNSSIARLARDHANSKTKFNEAAPRIAMSAEESFLDGEHVHRAALALGIAVAAAGQFRHHALRIHAAGQHMAVIAVAGDDLHRRP